MTSTTRVAGSDGQLVRELRSRDLSGFPYRTVLELAELLDDIGAPCCACGPTAAALHRFDGFALRPPFHVLVPRRRNVRRLGHVVHTSLDVPLIDRTVVETIPTTSATRALIEIASCSTPQALTAALDSALRDGRTSEDFLHRRIADLRTSGRYGIPALLSVIDGCEITRGAHSWLEKEFLRLLHRHGLPRPSTQQVLSRRKDHLVRVDFRFDGTPVVVETLGYRWHRSAGQMGIDTQRLNRLLIDGFVPLQFTYERVVTDGDGAVAEVREALRPYLARSL
jgi:very-short-patch-repair endonuclease